jgi:membrane protein YdbS with pleckstrin-like domain
MTIVLASNTMQAMGVVFMTVCVTLKAFKIIETVSLLVAMAMGAVLLACSGILARNFYMAVVMFSIHLVCALLVIAVTRERRWRLRRSRG